MRVDPTVRADPDDDDSVENLLEDARAWARVRTDAVIDPARFLGRVAAVLLGARLDGFGGRFELTPALVPGWKAVRVRRLRAHRTLFDLEVKPRAEWVTIKVAVVYGPSLPVVVRLADSVRVARVAVDEVLLESRQAIFTAAGEHEVTLYLGG